MSRRVALRPGVCTTDEGGVVTAKFFHESYKRGDSPEALIDAALGKIVLSEDATLATSPRV